MKLVFVGTSPEPRGTEQHMVTLASAVRRLGHEVHVLTVPGGFAWNALAGSGVVLHAGRFRVPFDPRGLVPLLRLVRHVRPDFVVAGMAKEFYAAMIAGRAVLFRHLDRPFSAVKRWAINRFAFRLFAVSRAVVNTLAMPNVRVLYNPIRPMTLLPSEETAARVRLGIPIDARVIAYAGAFSVSKGVFALRDAVGPLLGPHVRMLWLGGGKDEPALRATTGEFHHYGTWQSDARLVYAGIDILVVPSLAKESASRVAAEAQLLGKVVCGSSVGGIPEMLCPEMRGFLRPGGDVAGLRAVLTDLLARTDLIALGEVGKRYVETSFLDERIAREFLASLSESPPSVIEPA